VRLRIVTGSLPSDVDASALEAGRDRLVRAAGVVGGLENVIVAVRHPLDDRSSPAEHDAVVVSVWLDAATMGQVVAGDGEASFLNRRMGLPFRTSAVAEYEVVARTFAALPPETTACIRVLTVRAEARDDALLATLRGQQERIVDYGVIASQLGVRSLPDAVVEVAGVSVWPDRDAVGRATGGQPDRPVLERELGRWLATVRLATYDGIEIAPRLPTHAGPPLVILDQDLRIVDITATAAAILGLPPPELIDKRFDAPTPTDTWHVMLRSGSASGALEWSIADIGTVLIHVVARRDAPVTGRHAVFVRRRQDPAPTLDDLDAALSVAFPGRTSGTGRLPAG